MIMVNGTLVWDLRYDPTPHPNNTNGGRNVEILGTAGVTLAWPRAKYLINFQLQHNHAKI